MADELANASMTMPAPEAAAPMGAPVENVAPAADGQNAGGDQGLTFKSQAEFDQAVDARLNALKQDWLNEAYRNTHSMNDKHTQAVQQMMQRLQAAGIKADQVQAAKMVQAEQQAQAQAQRAPQVDPGYQQFLDRFGAGRNARDQRLKDAYALETEFATQLMRDDPEYQKYFGDPKKDFGSGYMFQRAYEKALLREDPLILGLRIRCRALGMEMVEFQALYVTGICTAAQGLDKDMGNTCYTTEMDVTVGLDMADSLVGSHETDWIHRTKILSLRTNLRNN